MSDHQQQALEVHNKARREAEQLHGGVYRPPLQWDDDLAQDAQAYANELARTEIFDHSQKEARRGDQGENLAWFKGYSSTFADASQDWVNEVKDYHGEKIGSTAAGLVVGHYTQCVWPETKKVGMGSAKAAGSGRTYVVARYSPSGNIRGLSAWSRSDPNTGGFYIVDGRKGSEWRGTLAWYSPMVGGNVQKEPDFDIDIFPPSGEKPDWAESGNEIDFKFGDVVLTINYQLKFDEDIKKANVGEKVGDAIVNGRELVVKKEKERILYTTKDGWTFSTRFSAK